MKKCFPRLLLLLSLVLVHLVDAFNLNDLNFDDLDQDDLREQLEQFMSEAGFTEEDTLTQLDDGALEALVAGTTGDTHPTSPSTDTTTATATATSPSTFTFTGALGSLNELFQSALSSAAGVLNNENIQFNIKKGKKSPQQKVLAPSPPAEIMSDYRDLFYPMFRSTPQIFQNRPSVPATSTSTSSMSQERSNGMLGWLRNQGSIIPSLDIQDIETYGRGKQFFCCCLLFVVCCLLFVFHNSLLCPNVVSLLYGQASLPPRRFVHARWCPRCHVLC